VAATTLAGRDLSVTDDEFLDAFEACTIPYPSEWTHRAHLRVAYAYLGRHRLGEAIARMRKGLQRFNAVNRVPSGPTTGYHETLTQMWMRILQGLRTSVGPEASFDAFLERHPYLGQKLLGRLFYTRERMGSDRAKFEYLPPDLTPFPGGGADASRDDGGS
jgi:hypothetical protein